MPADIILTTGPLGGLGDVSLYTTLPQRFHELGHKVYVDQDNAFRNPEIGDLWYGMNPYIEGSTDRKPNAGYVNQGEFYRIANAFPIGSIEAMERAHGLPPPYSLAPRFYYQPKPFYIDLSETLLVDVSARSSTIGATGLAEHLTTKMHERFAGKRPMLVTFNAGILAQTPQLNGPSLRVNSIFEYVDALAACYAIVCSEAGSQALAAATRGEHDVYDHAAHPEIVSIISPKTFNSRGYTFRGVDYRVCTDTSNNQGDYWNAVEQPYQSYQVLCRRSVEAARLEWDTAQAAREAASAAAS